MNLGSVAVFFGKHCCNVSFFYTYFQDAKIKKGDNAMKNIIVNIGTDGSVSCSDDMLGNCGEHNCTALKLIVLDPSLTDCDFFRVWIGDRYSERLTAENGTIEYTVPQDALMPPEVDMQLCGYRINDGTVCYIAKSAKVKFKVDTSVCSRMLGKNAVEPFEAYSLECGKAADLAYKSSESAAASAAEAKEAEQSAAASSAAAASSRAAAESAAAEISQKSENIINAVNSGSVSPALVEQNSNAQMRFWVGTRAEFAQITAPENNTLYLFTDDKSYTELKTEVKTEVVTEVNEGLDAKIDQRIAEQKNLTGILNAVYPVGSVYISVNDTSPSQLFGGTWEKMKDRFLLGSGDTYSMGATGGAATVTLSVNQMPKHKHSNVIYTAGGSTSGGILSFSESGSGGGSAYNTNETGGDQAHENMPPYIVVSMWKRTA